jgi:hypothetical protein
MSRSNGQPGSTASRGVAESDSLCLFLLQIVVDFDNHIL